MQEDINMMDCSPQPRVDEDGSVVLYLYGGVTPPAISRVINEIHHYGNAPSIQLRIKSNGGDADEAFGLVSLIREYDVATHVDGFAFSAAFLIFMAGRIRTMSPNSKLMHHELRYPTQGTLTKIEREVKEMRKRQDMIDEIILNSSDFSKEYLRHIYETQKDWFIDFNDAVEMSMVTHVLHITETIEEVDVPIEDLHGNPALLTVEQPVRQAEYITLEEYNEIRKGKSIK